MIDRNVFEMVGNSEHRTSKEISGSWCADRENVLARMLHLLPLFRAAVGYTPLQALGPFACRTPGLVTRIGKPNPNPLSSRVKSDNPTCLRNGVKTSDSKSPSNGGSWPRELSADYMEQFIPFNKHVLQQMLMKELSSVSEPKRASLKTLIDEAEAITLRHYNETMERLMALYEPINPDRDTLPELLAEETVHSDQEMILLDNLHPVLEQANFNRLSEEAIHYALLHHDPLFKVQVKVRLADYDYMKFWALGIRVGTPQPLDKTKEERASKRQFFQRMVKMPMERRYCKRVVMAARLRNGRLVLKSFKDIPLENLEHLLPSVRMRISFSDRTLLYFTLVVGGSALFANLTVLGFYSLKVDFLLLFLLFTVLMTQRSQRLFRLKRDKKALDHSTMLHDRTTSNNAELLVALVHRAQQEHMKELMLAHTFMHLVRLHHQPEASPDRGE
ncbi:transmembrane protein 143-like [Heterodontus francisci]|uniref:transmembrane protein 143-like n=1 Tax=Heterodontus francisci TaxID=7792 RepID=UPI00355AF8C1